jgi:outer membrane protein TolC
MATAKNMKASEIKLSLENARTASLEIAARCASMKFNLQSALEQLATLQQEMAFVRKQLEGEENVHN